MKEDEGKEDLREISLDLGNPNLGWQRITLATTVLVAILSIIFFWIAFQQIQINRTITQRVDAIEKINSDEMLNRDYFSEIFEPRVKNLHEALQANEERQSELTFKLEALKQIVESNKITLAEFSGSKKDSLYLAEIYFLLRMANHSLMIMDDIKSAIAILSEVEGMLKRLNRSNLVIVRKAVEKDLAFLRSQPVVDVKSISFQIAELISRIDSLRLLKLPKQEKNEEDQDQYLSKKGFLRFNYETALNKLSDLFVIRKSARSYQTLLDPQFNMLAKKNVRVLLKQAQLALLSKDSDLYVTSLKQVDFWLEEILSPSDSELPKLKNEINALLEKTTNRSSLDLSESIMAMEGVIKNSPLEKRDF